MEGVKGCRASSTPQGVVEIAPCSTSRRAFVLVDFKYAVDYKKLKSFEFNVSSICIGWRKTYGDRWRVVDCFPWKAFRSWIMLLMYSSVLMATDFASLRLV